MYGIISSAALYIVKTRRPSLLLLFAVLFSLMDSYIPFSYPSTPTDRVLEMIPLQFMFTLLRPAKMLMLAFDRGFLARAMSMKQHILLSVLPVVPLKSLPEGLQKRIPAFRPSAGGLVQLGLWGVVVVMGAAVTCSMDPSSTGYIVRTLRHMVAFMAFMHVLLLGAAFLASAVGSEPVVRPFNSFWLAESVAEFWNYRWNAVIGTSLRCTVYMPIVDCYKAGSPGKAVPLHTKMLAGCATFAYSAIIHEQVLMNQREFSAAGLLTAFFMLQPVLVVVQPWLADLVTSGVVCPTARIQRKQDGDEVVRVDGRKSVHNGKETDVHAGLRRNVGQLTTVTLGFGTIALLWCPAWDLSLIHI